MGAGLVLSAGVAAQAADAALIALEAGVCRRLAEHVPDADVAYRPGVDVRGNPVASADLAPPIVLPQVFTIPLEIDLHERFGIPADPTFFQGTIALGTVRVEGNRVTYNGQPLSDPQAQVLVELCRRHRLD